MLLPSPHMLFELLFEMRKHREVLLYQWILLLPRIHALIHYQICKQKRKAIAAQFKFAKVKETAFDDIKGNKKFGELYSKKKHQ